MIIPDVNVLLGAFKNDGPLYPECSQWLRRVLDSDDSIGLSDGILAGVVRVSTDRRIYEQPSQIDRALDFTKVLLGRPNAIRVTPGERHREIFDRLCRRVGTKGPLVQDAFHAALAIEWGAELITFDRDFARFPGLRWRPPFETE